MDGYIRSTHAGVCTLHTTGVKSAVLGLSFYSGKSDIPSFAPKAERAVD